MQSDRERLWLSRCLSHPPTPCPAPQVCIWPRSWAERAPMESTGLQKGLHRNHPEPGRACEVGCKSWKVHILPVPDISGAWRNLESLWNFLSISFLKCH